MFVSVQLGRGFKGLVEYQLEKDRDEPNAILGGNLPASDRKLAIRQLVECAEQRKGVRSPVLHMVAAWHPDDQVSDDEMAEAGERLLTAYGFDLDQHQYLMVRHHDKPHPHLHVVANRVGMDGGLVKDKGHPLKRLRAEADALERERGYTPAIPLEERQGAAVPDLRSMGEDPAQPGRSEGQVHAMERRLGVKAAKRLVHEAVRRAILQSDGTFGSVDQHLREEGVAAASWSFNGKGEFNGASFTLLSSTRPGEAEVGPHGGTFTFKGSQLGPKPGLSKGAILAAMDRKASSAKRREFASRKELFEAARALKAIRQGVIGRLTVGGHLGRRLSNRASYLSPLTGGSVDRVLKLFDNRRLARIHRSTPVVPIRRLDRRPKR